MLEVDYVLYVIWSSGESEPQRIAGVLVSPRQSKREGLWD